MRFIAFFVFVAVPLAELALLIKVGELIGVLPTVLLVIVTAMLGVTLLRIQGLTVLQNARNSLEAGRAPIDSVIDGVLLLVAGAFLLTPGLLTDTVGFLLLVPQVRRAIGKFTFDKLLRSGSVTIDGFSMRPGTPGPDRPAGDGPAGTRPQPPGGPTIEGEFSRVDDEQELRPEADEKKPASRERKSSPWRH